MDVALLTFDLRSESDVTAARQRTRQVAGLLGFGVHEQTRISTAVSEVARNAVQYAGGGNIAFTVEGTPARLMIRIRDQGPGIANLESLLSERSRPGTAPGMGLQGARRLMETFKVDSAPGRGTTVELGKRLPAGWSGLTPARLALMSGELGRIAPKSQQQELEQQNQELLRTMEELKARQLLLESLSDHAICSLDPQGRFTSWNSGAQHLHGYGAHEVLGQSFALLFTPEELAQGAPKSVLEAAAARARFETEGWRVYKDGTRFWANWAIAAIRDDTGQLLGFAHVARDFTERRHAEEQQRLLSEASLLLASTLVQRDSLERLGQLVVDEHLADWCFIELSNERHQLSAVVAAHREPLERARAAHLIRTLAEGPAAARSTQTHAGRTSEAWPAPGASGFAGQPPGEEHWALLRKLEVGAWVGVPLHARGQVLGVLTLARTAPAHSFTQQEIALAEELGYRAAVSIDNAQLYAGAQTAIRVRDEFLTIASHELRTPLTALQLGLDVLGRALRSPQSDGARLAQRVDVANRQAQRLTRVVENLLDVSRGEDQRPLQLSRFDLGQMAQAVVARMQKDFTAAGCEVSLHADRAVEGIWDRERLEAVLTALLSNAIKYGPSRPVDIEVRSSDGLARLSVTDLGIGMEPETIGRVFDRFERAVSTRNYGGFGLGLFLARQGVEAHHGSIHVKSQPGQGSTFTVLLPLGAAALQSVSPVRSEEVQ